MGASAVLLNRKREIAQNVPATHSSVVGRPDVETRDLKAEAAAQKCFLFLLMS
jgi:hypothetical protein